MLQFRHVGRTTVRDQVNANILAELEFGLLKKHSQDAKLGAAEKTVLLEMTIDHLEAQQEHMILEVHVRSLCHSRTVTADFLSFAERFNMKKCILCIGDVGSSDSPWAQLVQPSVYLFQKEYNIIFIESPTLGKSPQRWMKYGPAIYRGALRFLKISTVNVFVSGSGGILFHQLLSETPEILGPAHIAYNLDVPPGVKTLPFEIIKVEEALRDNNMQIWCMYQEDEDTTDPGAFSKSAEGPQKMFDALSKIQARLESERRRSGGSDRNYDEIIFSDRMNFPKGPENVSRVTVSKMSLHIFAESCLEVMAHYFRQLPSTFQDNVNDGLVKDMLDYFREDMLDEFNMPAIKNVNLNRSEEARKVVAAANRERLELVQESMNILALGNSEKPSLEAPPAKVETLSLARRSTGSKNASKRRTKSNLTVVSEDEERIAEAVEDEETDEDLFDDTQDYKSQWASLNDLKADYLKSPTAEKGAPNATASSADPGPLAIEQGMPGD